jgi:hypothetical protein
LGGNCASVTAAGASVKGATVAPANSAAPKSRHFDLIRIPHLVIARNRLAERAVLRQFCCSTILNSLSRFWIKSRASIERSPARKTNATIAIRMQIDTVFCNNLHILLGSAHVSAKETLRVL